jgi:cyclopropane-fatty-acyl-phospholipid synthase
MSSKSEIIELLNKADIQINGSRPADIQVHNEGFYQRFLRDGRLGLGESYVEGWWDCDDLEAFIYKLFLAQDMMRMRTRNPGFILWALLSKFRPYGSPARSGNIAKAHYSIGNDLYRAMLDRRMVYTCAYWDAGAKDLDQAQEHKLELVCRKLMLKPGMHILDAGCGFGGLAKYAAEHYDVKVTAFTISDAQAALGRELCKGLPVDLHCTDYRKLSGQYDRIAAIGMMEHIGLRYHRIFMKKIKSLLKPDGIFLMHTIGSNHSHFSSPWLEKYIFPGCFSPSIKHIGQATEELFFMEDWHNIGPNYSRTLLEWYHNFNAAWPTLSHKYGERFYRLWKFYLLSMAPGFKTHAAPVWQIVMTHKGLKEGYQAAYRQSGRLRPAQAAENLTGKNRLFCPETRGVQA